MEKLLNYQQSFYKAIFENNYKILQEYIGEIENFEDRFNIYLNNIFSSLKRVLKDDFPLCRQILGEQKFNQVSFEFVRHFPPTSGCLLDYGHKFPSFLNKFFPEFPYLRDLSQIEWAKKKLYYEEDTNPLDPQVISVISTAEYPLLSFEFPKATFFFKSSYPLEAIWETIERGENVANQSPTPSYCLVIRPRFKVQHSWLSADDFHFLKTLYETKNLSKAYDCANMINSEFNLSEALARALKREYFTKVRIDHDDRKNL